MSKMKHLFYILTILLSLSACSSDEDTPVTPSVPGAPTEARGPFHRTVLFYISGENNLSQFIAEELTEIRKGSIAIGNNAVVVYVDDSNGKRLPYILWIKEGVTMDSLTLESDPLSSSPETIKYVLEHTSKYYPADEYGLVLWGHSTGWIFEDSVATAASRRGFGIDNGMNGVSIKGKWININSLAKTLWEWKHLKFIFADCCQFQCVESAYELRNVTDYIIGSPAEIPGKGAPYNTVMRGFFEDSESFYKTITDAYFDQQIPISYSGYSYNSRAALSVIKTYEMSELAKATQSILQSFVPTADIDLLQKNLIYYRGDIKDQGQKVMYDMNDLIREYTQDSAEGQQAYADWKEVFDRTVVYRKNAKDGWMTNNQIQVSVFTSGMLTDERYGGMSMFIPQNRPGSWYKAYTDSYGVQHAGYNADIKKTSWYYAAGLADFGW